MAGELRIAEWPAEERPRERLYHKGAAALSDAELLAIQLGTGTRGISALDGARGLRGGGRARRGAGQGGAAVGGLRAHAAAALAQRPCATRPVEPRAGLA